MAQRRYVRSLTASDIELTNALDAVFTGRDPRKRIRRQKKIIADVMPWAQWEYGETTLPASHDYQSAWEWLGNMANIASDHRLSSEEVGDIALGMAMLYKEAYQDHFRAASPSDEPVYVIEVLPNNMSIDDATDILVKAARILEEKKV